MNPLHLFLWPTGLIRPFSYGANMMCASLLAVLPVLLLNLDSFGSELADMRSGSQLQIREWLTRPDVQAAFLFGLWMHTCLSCKRARDAWGSPALGIVYGLAGASVLAFGREDSTIALGAELAVLAISVVLVSVRSQNCDASTDHAEEPSDHLSQLTGEDLRLRAALLKAGAEGPAAVAKPVAPRPVSPRHGTARPAFGKR